VWSYSSVGRAQFDVGLVGAVFMALVPQIRHPLDFVAWSQMPFSWKPFSTSTFSHHAHYQLLACNRINRLIACNQLVLQRLTKRIVMMGDAQTGRQNTSLALFRASITRQCVSTISVSNGLHLVGDRSMRIRMSSTCRFPIS